MGQGAQTALAMMAAEEMDADWTLVHVKEAPALDAYANAYVGRAFLDVPGPLQRGFDYGTYRIARMAGVQFTGGSLSVRSTRQYGMRIAGAAAKEMLVAAAAEAVRCARLEVHRRQLARDPRVWPFRQLRRAREGGGHAVRAVASGVEGSQHLHTATHIARAVGHAVESGWQRHLRH